MEVFQKNWLRRLKPTWKLKITCLGVEVVLPPEWLWRVNSGTVPEVGWRSRGEMVERDRIPGRSELGVIPEEFIVRFLGEVWWLVHEDMIVFGGALILATVSQRNGRLGLSGCCDSTTRSGNLHSGEIRIKTRGWDIVEFWLTSWLRVTRFIYIGHKTSLDSYSQTKETKWEKESFSNYKISQVISSKNTKLYSRYPSLAEIIFLYIYRFTPIPKAHSTVSPLIPRRIHYTHQSVFVLVWILIDASGLFGAIFISITSPISPLSCGASAINPPLLIPSNLFGFPLFEQLENFHAPE